MRVYGQWQNDDQGRRVLGLLAIRNGVPAYPGDADVYRTITRWLDANDDEYGLEYIFSGGQFRLRKHHENRKTLNFEFQRTLNDMDAAGVIPKWWTYAGIWGASA